MVEVASYQVMVEVASCLAIVEVASYLAIVEAASYLAIMEVASFTAIKATQALHSLTISSFTSLCLVFLPLFNTFLSWWLHRHHHIQSLNKIFSCGTVHHRDTDSCHVGFK